MRISDWSSDVCSSDLREGHALLGARLADVADLLGVRGAGRSALRGEVVDDDADIAAIGPAEAGDFAVARRAGHVLLEDCRRAEQPDPQEAARSEEHTSELQSLMRISYAVFCLQKKKT